MSVKHLMEQEAFSGDTDELNEHVHEPGDPDGVIAAEERAKSHPQSIPVTGRRKRRWPVVLLTLLVIAAAAVGAYWFGNHQASAPSPQPTPRTQAKQSAPAATAATKHYDSTTYTLGFDYPDTWTVADTAAKLTVTSPATNLTTPTGTVSGQVVVTIQNQQTAIPGYPAGGAVAALASDHLTYKQPSAVQRAQTYLSYLSYQAPTGLDTLYITGDSGYQAGQQVPLNDVLRGNPLISVSFVRCSAEDCPDSGTPLTIQADSWSAAAFKKPVIDLLQSIVLS